MFDQTFVEAARNTKKPLSLAFSLFIQISVVGILVFIPLIYTQTLPGAQLRSLIVAPPPPIAAASATSASNAQPKPLVRLFNSRRLVARPVIPDEVNAVDETAPDTGIIAAGYAAGGPDAPAIGLLNSLPGTAPPPVVPAPPKAKPSSRPVLRGGALEEANLIHKVLPGYPTIAKSARIQGAVEFTAVISREGTVESLQVVRGHPLLVKAAREAVLQWKYRPTLLNGQPVEVITDIVVNFILNSQ